MAGALPAALQAQGASLRLLLPGFPAIRPPCATRLSWPRSATPGAKVVPPLLRGSLPGFDGIPAYVIEAPELYDRPGNPYHDEGHIPYADNHRRFALLGLAAARLAEAWTPTGGLTSSMRTTGTRASPARKWPPAASAARTQARSVFTIPTWLTRAPSAPARSMNSACRRTSWAVEGVRFTARWAS